MTTSTLLHTRETLRLCTAGSVDDGKSTLVGRLLHDTRSVLADTLASVERTSADRGFDGLDLSLLVTAGAMLGQAKGLANLYAEVFGGLNFSLEADLKADDTGKLRLADLLDILLDLPPDTGLSSIIAAGPGNLFALLGDNILDLVDFKGALDLTAGGELGLKVDLTPEDKSNLGAVTKALSDAYAAAASWLDLETQFDWAIGGEFTIPVFQFDTANGSFLLNV